MTNRKTLQTKINRTTQIEIGVGTGIAIGMGIAMVRRNLMIGMAVGFMAIGLIVAFNRHRLSTT